MEKKTAVLLMASFVAGSAAATGGAAALQAKADPKAYYTHHLQVTQSPTGEGNTFVVEACRDVTTLRNGVAVKKEELGCAPYMPGADEKACVASILKDSADRR